MTLLEFRNNDEAEWGRSRVENATLDKLALRRRERTRRERFMQENRERQLRDDRGRYVKPESGPVEGEVFMTASGFRAYVSTIANLSSGPGAASVEFRRVHVSLPYISLQHRGYEQAKSA